MGNPTPSEPALRILAAFSRYPEALAWARQTAVAAWGPVALESQVFAFEETDYYQATMGPGLSKCFWAFETLYDPAEMVETKLQTNDWELDYARAAEREEPRPLNLDPGYLTNAKLILASTKDYAHRIYLSRGIYAEVTLQYQERGWRDHRWTFPDYKRADYQEFFTQALQLFASSPKAGAAMIPWLVIGAILPSLAIAWAAAWIVRRKAVAWGLVDQPGHRKVHTQATPLGGGVAIWLGVVLTFAIGQIVLAILVSATWHGGTPFSFTPSFLIPHLQGLWEQTPNLWFLLGAGTVLMLLGLADDRFKLSWKPRLGIQFAVAAIVVAKGWKLTFFIDVPGLTSVISVFWIVALINSFNMLDNMDGLSAGVATVAASILAAVMLLAPDPETNQPQLFVAGFLLVLVGSLLGFLIHNRPPAKLFMGDAGSYFIGFCLAVATIMATFSGGALPRHSILAPLCVLAVPLYDMTTVILIRVRNGRSPFEADKNHFSHRLVDLGMTKVQAVLTIYLMTATCGLSALLLHQVNTGGAVIIMMIVTCVLMLVGVLETTVRRSQRSKT